MIDEVLFNIALENTQLQNNLEEKLALEMFGKHFAELDDDETDIIIYEAIDRMK